MPTAFRTTATLPDSTGRFRTSLLIASRLYGEWSEQAKADFIERQQLPAKALTITDSEYDALEADPASRLGYADAPGDVDSPFVPAPWATL